MSLVKTRWDRDAVTLTLDRPPLNILNIATLTELNAAIREAAQARLLILAGEGKAFSAGADVAEHLPDKVEEMLRVFHETFRLLDAFKGVVVSRVHGPALGGGCELALFADIVLASKAATFGQPEIKLGVFPPVALALLGRSMPRKAALELILTGDTLPAEEALRLGLVNKVFDAEGFGRACDAALERFMTLSPATLKLAKAAFKRLHDGFLGRLDAAEDAYLNGLMRTKDPEEGCRAFLEKRKPVWSAP